MRTSPAATLLCACLAVLTASPAALADAHYQPWYLADYDGRIPQQPGDGYNYSISFKISDPNTVGSSVSTDILVSQQWVQLDPSATDIYERAMSVQQHDGDYRTWDVVFEMNDSPIPGNPPYNSPVVDFAVGITLTYPQEDGGGRYAGRAAFSLSTNIMQSIAGDDSYLFFELSVSQVDITPAVRK